MQKNNVTELDKIKKAKETEAVFDNAMAVAAVGIAALKSIEDVLAYAAGMVEHASCNITDNFKDLSKKLEDSPDAGVQANIRKIILDMQFQDKNTQLMQNASGILAGYRELLIQMKNALETLSSGDKASDININNAVQTILTGICLSDVRTNFMAALSQAKVNYDVNEATPIGERNQIESIELF